MLWCLQTASLIAAPSPRASARVSIAASPAAVMPGLARAVVNTAAFACLVWALVRQG